MYIRDDLKVTPVNVNTERPEGVEDIWVAVHSRMFPAVIVGRLYNQSINGGIRRGARRLANPTTPNRGVPPG